MPAKRRVLLVFWRIVNPVVMLVAGVAPWWLVIETTGRRSGLPRQLPLARGPVDGDVFWLIAAHGRRAQFVRNLLASPEVRIRHRGAWRTGVATVEPMEPATLARFNFYARHANMAGAIDPTLLRVDTSPR